jgi:hypothetical protein
VAAAALVVWGARTDRRWVVPVASTIALPVLWITGPAILVAIPRLRGSRVLPERPQAEKSAYSGKPIPALAARAQVFGP